MGLKKNHGFSLIEFVFIMIIISIIAVPVYYKNQPVNAVFNISAIADQLKSDVRYTQILSLSLSNSYSIQLSSTSYKLLNPDGSNFAYPIPNSSPINLPTGVTLSPTQTITFDGNGRPTVGTTISILASGGTTRTLTLQAQTGFIDG